MSKCDAEALKPAAPKSNDVRVYEFGVRLDPECIAAADEQVRKARALYNDIIACMRRTFDEMQAWVMDRAGDDGRRIKAVVDELNVRFAAAKADNDEPAMKAVAAQRREAWREQSSCLGAVRKSHAAAIRELFYSRIGRNSSQEPYQLRCAAVAGGLGWATANDVLERSLDAWRASMKLGRPPTFCRGDEKMQDSLVLQFTAAGGVDSTRIVDGSHSECAIKLPESIGPRQYGSFRFRLGAGKAMQDATGTVQVHRSLPEAAVSGARLVRRRHANKMKWVIQFVLRLREPVERHARPLATLACVHFGWASDTTGRRVAGVADAADPGLARLLQLPPSIEEDLLRATAIQSERDQARDTAVPLLKELARQDGLVPLAVDGGVRTGVAKELDALRRLPAQHISAKRFYVLQHMLRSHGVEVPWLSEWVANDRKQWQAAVGIARRARLRRRDFYGCEALSLARKYSAIVIEPLDLQGAAIKIDPKSGERSEFAKKARAGRVVASLFEFEQELRKAAADYGRALFEMEAQTTIRRCASCGADAAGCVAGEDSNVVTCSACGATSERKRHGAAVAWQIASADIEDRILDFHSERLRAVSDGAAETADRKRKMAEGRRAAREARAAAAQPPGGSPRVS